MDMNVLPHDTIERQQLKTETETETETALLFKRKGKPNKHAFRRRKEDEKKVELTKRQPVLSFQAIPISSSPVQSQILYIIDSTVTD